MNTPKFPSSAEIQERLACRKEGKITAPLTVHEHSAFMDMARDAATDPNVLLRDLFKRWKNILPTRFSDESWGEEPELKRALQILDKIALYRADIDLITPLPPLGENCTSLEVHLGQEAASQFNTLRELGTDNRDESFLRRAVIHIASSPAERKQNGRMNTMTVELPVDLLEKVATIAKNSRRGIEDVIQQSVKGWEGLKQLMEMAAPPDRGEWRSGPIR